MFPLRFLVAALVALLMQVQPTPMRAAENTLLTVTLPDRQVQFSRADLEALPSTEFVTTTIWTEGPQKFEGVRMTDLLDHLDVHSGTLQLIAANDYAITIPIDTFRPDGALLAYERNDSIMSLRTKGPLWLVYPYDSSADFRSEVIYSNSIWQLDRLAIDE